MHNTQHYCTRLRQFSFAEKWSRARAMLARKRFISQSTLWSAWQTDRRTGVGESSKVREHNQMALMGSVCVATYPVFISILTPVQSVKVGMEIETGYKASTHVCPVVHCVWWMCATCSDQPSILISPSWLCRRNMYKSQTDATCTHTQMKERCCMLPNFQGAQFSWAGLPKVLQI